MINWKENYWIPKAEKSIDPVEDNVIRIDDTVLITSQPTYFENSFEGLTGVVKSIRGNMARVDVGGRTVKLKLQRLRKLRID
jgi:hypothetical protein